MVKKGFRHKWIFGILIALVLLVLCFYDLDFSRLWQTLKKIRFTYLIPALVFAALKVFFGALRWKMLIDKRKRISVRKIFSVYSVGQLVNISLPALTGQAARVVILNKVEKLPKTFGATTILMEATLDGTCLTLLLLVTSLFFQFPGWFAYYASILGIVLLALILVYVLILINRRGLTYFGKKKLRRRFPRLYKQIEKFSKSFTAGLDTLTSLKHIIMVFMYSGLMWACSIAIVMSLIAAFDEAFGLNVPFWMAMVFVAITSFFTIVPITPGNVGTFQWIVIATLKTIYKDLDKEIAVGFSIILHFLNLAGIWILGLIFLFLDHFGVSEIRKESMQTKFPDENNGDSDDIHSDVSSVIDEVKND
jgi:uncharacterized protein (TIRG00374 family)